MSDNVHQHRRGVLAERARTDPGEEVDPRPVEIPAELKRPPSLKEQMQQMIRQEMSLAAAQANEETFEEADDFDIDDIDTMPESPYNVPEEDFVDMLPETLESLDGADTDKQEPDEGHTSVSEEKKNEDDNLSD